MSRVQSIERAFAVLGALTAGPIGVTEVADRVSLPKSTAARMLVSLAREGAVEQIPGDTRYRLGPRIESLATGLVATRSVVAIARPHLAELAASIGEAAGLSIPEGDTMHYVEQVDSDHPVGVRDWTGSRIAMHAVSSGLAVLALWPRARIEAYLGRPMERFTDRTMTDPVELRTRLQRIQLDGRAWTNGEYAEGIASVAAAIADDSGEVVAAVHVHGPSYRFPPPGREEALGLLVATTATRIARTLRQSAG
ncbi:MAG TPA: IclR family transcriptional regulator [Candidatus Limnocylindrales bacterium]|nr:IclR family transcriptional regulator [Candidatus Limnocylindrales bacterium]